MNFKCIICSDLITASADILTTPCGHLFHYSCLLQWLERSRTCPQCRTKTTEKTVHRIFISVEDNLNSPDDVATLQNQVDNLHFQLKMKTMDYDQAKEKLQVSTNQTAGLRKEVKDLEDQVKVLNSAMLALKEQVKHFKTKAKEVQRYEEEVEILKNKINNLEHVQVAITGSREQVNDMLRHNRDPQSLIVLVSTLKKELLDSDRKRKQIQVLLKDAQNEVHTKVRELMLLSKQNTKLLQEVEVHKSCESERAYLKKKLSELQVNTLHKEHVSHNTTIDRILLESPVQLPKDKHFSPSLPEKVQTIKDSDSPYLQVHSTSVGLTELINHGQRSFAKKSSIFKNPTLKIETFKRPSSTVSYDGLGGHTKDEPVPTELPLSATQSAGKKRPKSSSTIPSAKLRKLAPQQKLDGFFDFTNDSF